MQNNIFINSIRLNDMLIGGSNDETFAEALRRFMKDCSMSVEQLSKMTQINPRSITRYRNGGNIGSVSIVVAICIALRLHISKSLYLIHLCGYSLNNSIEHTLYLTFLSLCYFEPISIDECNEVLAKYGFDPLIR